MKEKTRKEWIELAKLALVGADLHRAVLRDADLSGANLRGADLSLAELGNADLEGASLRDANLSGANLRDANLGYASLLDANLRGADLRGANLGCANLRGASLRDTKLPSPLQILSASWFGCCLSDELTNWLMHLDCSFTRVGREGFSEWARKHTQSRPSRHHACPLTNERFQRAVSFRERPHAWKPLDKLPRLYDIVTRLLKEACKWEEWE